MSGNFLKPLEVMDNGNFGFITDDSGTPSITVSSVSINETISSLSVGDTGTLTATVTYSDSSTASTADDPGIVTWSSSDESILTIDADGDYTALNVGSVTITAASTDDELINGALSINIDSGYDIEIIIGHHDSSLKLAGFSRTPEFSEFGELVSGTFPDGSLVIDAHASTSYYLQSADATLWNDYDRVSLAWSFEDGSTFDAKGLPFRDGRYELDTGSNKLYDILNERIGQSAKIKVTESKIAAKALSEIGKYFNASSFNKKPNFILIDGDIKNSE
ncbi:Ig domain-containing protein [Vibrio parahaemolyticus]|nr:Ig domain-containing protein [Vibrio parahaemolyticus]